MNKSQKDGRLVKLQCITALIGAVNMLINENSRFLLYYLLFMAVSVPLIYFNYSLCKWENKMHSRRNERTPCDGEPSTFRLGIAKIGAWGLFIFGLILALIPSI